MKHLKRILFFFLIIAMSAIAIFSCNKTTPDSPDIPGNEEPVDTTGLAGIFGQFDFFNAEKVVGEIGVNTSNTSLKKSFEDTLNLFEDLQMPFKFLHEDTLLNVEGVFISYDGSPFYYDVPELQESKSNDTVSMFTMGFKPVSGNLPAVFKITITPYIKSKKPVAQFKTHVNVKRPGDIDVNGFCGLLPDLTEYWDWELSYVPNENGHIDFINYPLKVWGEVGQQISGSCCGKSPNRTSIYGICPGADSANRSLHFNTFFGYPYEHFFFYKDGLFDRQTAQVAGKPDLNNSDWCTMYAKTDTSISLVKYIGDWSVTIRNISPGMRVKYSTREYLSLLTTKTDGGLGYGNPGGFIHILDCGGNLWLIQPDMEGGSQHLYKYYKRKNFTDEYWHIIDS